MFLNHWFSSNYFQKTYRKRFVLSNSSHKTVHGHWFLVGAKRSKLVDSLQFFANAEHDIASNDEVPVSKWFF